MASGELIAAPSSPRSTLSSRTRPAVSRALLLALILTATTSAAADDHVGDAFVEKELVIVQSTSDFAEAARTAASAALALSLRLDRRQLEPHPTTGLTFSRRECREHELEYPCYVPRGRFDDGQYASVEWSNDYDGFGKGLYVVVVSTDLTGSATTRRILAAARERFPDAYAKRAKVYAGCIH